MKILLLGKNGQLGTEIHKDALKRRWQIAAYGKEELNITNCNKVKKAIIDTNPDVVINATAFHVVPECEVYMDQAFLVNAISLKPIAEVCFKKKIKFISYSTDYIFDGLKGSLYIEEDKPNPLQIYGISKTAGEYIVLNYTPTGIVIRSSGVFGGKHGSRSKKGNFVLNILKEKNKRTLEVSSEQIVNPTYAVDLAKGSLDLLKQKNILGIYHLVNEGHCSWAEFAQEIMKLIGSKTKIIPVDRSGQSGGARRPLFSALKNTRAAKLGIKLPSWKDALERYLFTLK